jgi:hypothetical protein
MRDDIRRLVDLDDQALTNVSFGRNRFLRALGVALFGLVTRLAAPQLAHAYHGSPPAPCFGFGQCHCCSGTQCCNPAGCQYPGSLGCPGGGQCWYTCIGGSQLFKCCDWQECIPNPPPDTGCSWKNCACVQHLGPC